MERRGVGRNYMLTLFNKLKRSKTKLSKILRELEKKTGLSDYRGFGITCDVVNSISVLAEMVVSLRAYNYLIMRSVRRELEKIILINGSWRWADNKRIRELRKQYNLLGKSNFKLRIMARSLMRSIKSKKRKTP